MTQSLESELARGLTVPRGLEAFADAPPELLATRALLQRIDRKYLLSTQALDQLLPHLTAEYRVLRTAAAPAGRYDTRYFDTADRQCYQDHRRGRLPRYKVRIRHHIDRRMSFLEIKRKAADGRTRKSVLDRPFGMSGLDAEALAFIDAHCPLDGASLQPRLSTVFHRATLLGSTVNERITIDWGLGVFDDEQRECLPHIVIMEVKQARFSNYTPAVQAIRALHLRERSISKYCLGTARLAPVRTNTFKPALLAVERLSA